MIYVFGTILLCCAAFQSGGISGIFDLVINLTTIICGWFKIFNTVSVVISGDGILTRIFFYVIVFNIVKFLFEILDVEKGWFGKIFGKVLYWLIGKPISLILNFFNSLIFH